MGLRVSDNKGLALFSEMNGTADNLFQCGMHQPNGLEEIFWCLTMSVSDTDAGGPPTKAPDLGEPTSSR